MDTAAYKAGFINGVWVAVERLVLEWCIDPAAKKLLLDSKITEEEARQVVESKGYEADTKETLIAFIDEVYQKGEQPIFSDKENGNNDDE